jgi:hypothetical protein
MREQQLRNRCSPRPTYLIFCRRIVGQVTAQSVLYYKTRFRVVDG